MNARIICALLASFAIVLPIKGEPPTSERLKETTSQAVAVSKEKAKQTADAFAKSTREAWNKTKAYFTEDPATYRAAVTQRLNELGGEIARIREQSEGTKDRSYYMMRLQALDEHHKYTLRQLAELPPNDVKKGKDSLRTRLDVIIDRLEEHLELAREEGRDFVLAD